MLLRSRLFYSAGSIRYRNATITAENVTACEAQQCFVGRDDLNTGSVLLLTSTSTIRILRSASHSLHGNVRTVHARRVPDHVLLQCGARTAQPPCRIRETPGSHTLSWQYACKFPHQIHSIQTRIGTFDLHDKGSYIGRGSI